MSQLDFAPELEAPSRPIATSQQAARQVTPRLNELHQKVLRALQAGPRGADRIASEVGEHYADVRPRCTELQHAGYVQKWVMEGKVVRVLSCRGNEQCCWQITELGRQNIRG